MGHMPDGDVLRLSRLPLNGNDVKPHGSIGQVFHDTVPLGDALNLTLFSSMYPGQGIAGMGSPAGFDFDEHEFPGGRFHHEVEFPASESVIPVAETETSLH